ncbi:MAG: hypothetical protein ACREER_02070 [Alphaproteobacteria bacterium]
MLIVTADDAMAHAATEGVKALRAVEIERVGRLDRVMQTIAASRANLLIAEMDPNLDDARAMVRRLRTPKMTPSPHIVIVAVCLPLKRDDVVRAIRLGIDMVIVGPLTTGALVERYQTLMHNPPRPIEVATYIGPDRRRAPNQAYVGPNRRDGAAREPATAETVGAA